MTDDLEPLRRSRPDRLLPDDPPDPEILAREKARLMSAITGQDGAVVHRRTPAIYPRLAYRDEVAALDFLTRLVNVYLADIDAHYRRAESEGARIVTPLEDMFWGDRRYEALDLEGHRWHFAERVSGIRA